jgi:outer membrane protein assembly factor BamB
MSRLLYTALIIASITSSLFAQDEWPQFRGPGGEGHSDAVGLPLQWSETENIAWKVPVEGRAWSSPLVSGDQVWMTTAIDTPATPEETKAALEAVGMAVPSPEVASHLTLKAICVDLATGELVHSVTLFEYDKPLHICSTNSYASPSPIIENGRLYCDFGTIGVACLDTKTCEIVWTRSLPIEHQCGSGSSPALYEDMLIVVRDGCHVQYVAALDKATGETIWKTDRPALTTTNPPYKKAFSTPLVIDAEDGPQAVIPGAQWIASYNPETGEELWHVDTGPTFSTTTRPVFGHGMVYVSMAFGGTQLYAIEVDGRGDVTESHIAWTSGRQAPMMPSALLIGDELYTISDGGAATCYDAVTGETYWSERVGSRTWASPLYADDKIYLSCEDGTVYVVRPGVEFEELAENELDGRLYASPAVVENALLIRTDTHLYRIEE